MDQASISELVSDKSQPKRALANNPMDLVNSTSQDAPEKSVKDEE